MASMYCIVFAAFISATSVSGYGLAQKTSVACENGHANLHCPSGSTIHVTHAIYGRNERSTCRSRAMHNTHCNAGSSNHIASSHCNGHQSCSIHASNGVFGDPCRGTYKFLKVTYICNPSYHYETEYHYYDETKEEPSNDEVDEADEQPEEEDEGETEEDQPEDETEADEEQQTETEENSDAVAEEKNE